jgi:polyamine oxidase
MCYNFILSWLQHLNREYPGQNLVFVTVTDDEARRIEQLHFNDTLAEIMVVMRKMFGPDIPEATDIFYYRWWQDKFFRGTYSNWPVGVSTYEFKQLQVLFRR